MSAPHRDGLDAALARIAALEAEVRELEEAVVSARASQGAAGLTEERLRVERDQQRAVAAKLREELAQARADLAALQAPPRLGMPTALQHNLTLVPAKVARDRGLGVSCPVCAASDHERELVTIISNSALGPLGACPACGSVMVVRSG